MKSMRDLLKQKIDRLRNVKKIYDQTGTLQKTATLVGITRERVRQLLKEGENYGLYPHETYRSQRKNDLHRIFSRETLAKAIELHNTTEEIILKLGITKEEFKYLLKFFNIDRKKYVIIRKKGECLKQYINIVKILGYPPTTTELDSKHEWRNLWFKINRLWGSIDVFRKEYGIKKQKHKMALKLQEKWKKVEERDKKLKQYILGIIKINHLVSAKEVSIIFGEKEKLMHSKLLKTMVKEGTLITVGKSSATRYKMGN